MTTKTDDTVPLLYDADLRQPGCVLLQAAAGIPGYRDLVWRWSEWLVAPTPGMRRYRLTKAQWEQLAALDEKLDREPKRKPDGSRKPKAKTP